MYEKERFVYGTNQFQSKVLNIMECRRLVNDDNEVEIKNSYPNNVLTNNLILKILMATKESKNIVSQVLKNIYYDIRRISNENDNENDNDNDAPSANEIIKSTFCSYFASKFSSQSGSIKPNLENFLSIFLLQVSMFWKCVDSIMKHYYGEMSSSDKQSTLQKYLDSGMMDICMCDNYGQTLYHIAVTFDDSDTLEMLLGIDNDLDKYKTLLSDSPMLLAMEKGRWGIVKMLSLSKMGSKIKNMAKATEESVTLTRGIAHHILKEFGEKGIETVISKMISLISKQLPVSDDILLACWKYEEMRSKHNLNDNRIWQAIQKELSKVFSNSKNNRSWYWFEMYIWKSAVKFFFDFRVFLFPNLLVTFLDGPRKTS